MAKKKGNVIGGWAFLVGVILAIILGFMNSLNMTMTYILVIIGLVVVLLNVADEETQPFLMSGIVLIVASAFGRGVVSTVPELANVLDALLLIFVPATVFVAIRNVFNLAKH